MAAQEDEWTCPRCSLIGDHHKTPDPERCDECCAHDAALETLAALRECRDELNYRAGKGERTLMARALVAKADILIAEAEGRTS